MTNHARGSSLLQTRRSHIHRHLHDLRRNVHHVHHPRDVHEPATPSTTTHEQIEIREYPDLDHTDHPVVTQVVQTVSVVQYVDGNGATIDVSTVYSPRKTQVVDQLTGVTIEKPSDSVLPTTPVPVPSSPPHDGTAAATSSSPISQEATPPLTSSHSSSSALPSLPAATNSSTSSFIPHFNNSTSLSHSLFANSTRTTSSSSTPFFHSFTSSSSRSSSTTDDDSFTIFGGGPTLTTEPTLPATASSTTGSSSGSGSSQNTPTSTVVGGVVGGVAGLAILVLGAILLMRWKRRQNGVRLLGDGDAPASRSLGGPGGPFGTFAEASGGGGGGGGGGGSGTGGNVPMAERGLPFAIPATLAALSGYKRSSQATSAGGTDSSERGFARISGRKLPSVLQHGGDGFSDPHESVLSGQSFYRDSHGFWGGDGSPRFAVGSPMRPESGIPVMQPGPIRTPVTEQGPIFEHSPTQNSPGRNSPGLRGPASLDPLGRTHISQDGSRGSASRFTENI